MRKWLQLRALPAIVQAAIIFPLHSFAGTYSNPGFTENKGQYAAMDGTRAEGLLFRANFTNAPGIFITDKGITYVFTEGKKMNPDPNSEPGACEKQWSRADMVLENASIKKENAVCGQPAPGYSNFYYAHCPQGILYVKTYRSITFKNVYPGIDWTLYSNGNNAMEYDFIVHPGADPSRIKINYKGSAQLRLQEQDSKLSLFSSCGGFMEGKLFSYEWESGKAIASQYKIKDNGICFRVGNYNRNQTLVIDPPLQWSMFQAGSGFDYGYAIALAKDGTGNTLVTGVTDSPDFPVLNAFQGTLAGNEDMVVLRLNNSGARVWSTYYGGGNFDGGKGVGSDLNGNCFVAGYTGSANFPVLNPVQTLYGGGTYDIALVKFNASGVRQWATFYGGIGTDYGTALCTDNSGNSYITGYTNSNNFPLVNAISTGTGIATDAFIMKMSASQNVRWADFFGGNDDDRGRAVTLNPAGNAVYFAGSTLSTNLITTVGVFQASNASGGFAEDVFITRFDTSGQSVVLSTYCGGTDADFGQGIAVDANGTIYVTGYTLSSDFPTVNPGNGVAYYDNTIGSPGTHDAFIIACNANASAETWGTYYGGSGVDMGLAITSTSSDGIFVTGSSGSTDFPVQAPMDGSYYQAVQGDAGSFSDFFIGWFYTNNSMQWSTYYGGTYSDEGRGVCTDGTGNIYVVGTDSNEALVLKFAPGIVNAVQQTPAQAGFILFPQPAHDNLQLQASGSLQGEIEIYTVPGACVRKSKVSGSDTKIDISSLTPGTYFLRYRSPSGSTVKKFIKL